MEMIVKYATMHENIGELWTMNDKKWIIYERKFENQNSLPFTWHEYFSVYDDVL